MLIHNAGDLALGRAMEGAEALRRRTVLQGGTQLIGGGIYWPRVATHRGRLVELLRESSWERFPFIKNLTPRVCLLLQDLL